ncbi:hypothetical protein P8S54_04755 [Thiomicrospira sp. R3]|uniref:hypothetical protein n=1 Tax=Thiomicrospira sp. R3 TaxID=3035472 RepID=UPI00259B3B97|nr:hypothetical protein [Thiomicrospira sp. R3]WFE69615.1 hypothetical protein P8S54_04755 [Thiomicrospira sp. R3]
MEHSYKFGRGTDEAHKRDQTLFATRFEFRDQTLHQFVDYGYEKSGKKVPNPTD